MPERNKKRKRKREREPYLSPGPVHQGLRRLLPPTRRQRRSSPRRMAKGSTPPACLAPRRPGEWDKVGRAVSIEPAFFARPALLLAARMADRVCNSPPFVAHVATDLPSPLREAQKDRLDALLLLDNGIKPGGPLSSPRRHLLYLRPSDLFRRFAPSGAPPRPPTTPSEPP